MATFEEKIAQWEDVIQEKARRYGVHPDLVKSLIWQESRGNPQVTSSAGAKGLMQLMPGTAKDLGVNPSDPVQNIDGGIRYLKQQIDKFGLTGGVAAYNAGPGNVQKHGGIPPFKETQDYVRNVLGKFSNVFQAQDQPLYDPRKPLGSSATPSLNQYKISGLENQNGKTNEEKLSQLFKTLDEGKKKLDVQNPLKTKTPLNGVLADPEQFKRLQDPNLKNIFGVNPLVAAYSPKPDWEPIVKALDTPLLPKKGADILANILMSSHPLGVSFVANKANKYLGLPSSIPEPMNKIGTGIESSLSNNLEGFSSPKSLGIGALLDTPAAPLVLAAMTPGAVKGTYESGRQGVQDLRTGNYQGASENLANAAISGAMAYAGAKGAVKGLKAQAGPVLSSLKKGYQASPFASERGSFSRKELPETTIPEKPETLALQMGALQEGRTKAVLATPGSQLPEVPKGFNTLETKVGTWVYDPKQVKPYQINKSVEQGTHGELLGYVEPKGPNATQTMTASQGGVEAKTALVSPENMDAQIKAFKEQFPEAEIKVGGPEQSAQVLADRVGGDSGNVIPFNPKERGFITTVKESPMTPQPVAQGVSGSYNPITNQATLEAARKTVQADPIKARDLVLSSKEASAESNAIAMETMRHFNQQGDYKTSIDIANHMAAQATKQGQAIQALSMYDKLGPEGLQRLAVNTISKAREEMPQAKIYKLETKTKELTSALKGVEQDALTTLSKELLDRSPEQMLAKRVGNSVAEPKAKVVDPIKDMVDTLYQVAQQDLPKKVSVPKNPIRLIAEAIKNKDQYGGVWTKAQEIVKSKFQGNPEALAILEKYIKAPLETPYAQRQMARSIEMGMKAGNINLGEIVRQHYSATDKAQYSLANRLVQEAGLQGPEAATLSANIQSRFQQLVTEKKQQILKQTFGEKVKTDPKGPDQKILELSNLGAFDQSAYRELVAQKLGLPHLSPEMGAQITQKAIAIQAMPEGRPRALETAALLRDIGEMVPATLARKTSSFQAIAQLLNPKTITRNLAGNAAFTVAEGVKDLVAAPLDKGVSLITGQRTKMLGGGQVTAQVKGFMNGLVQGAEEAWKGVDLKNIADKWEFNTGSNGLPAGRTFRGKVLGNLERVMNITLKAPDRAFYQGAFDKSVAEQMKIAGVSKPTPEMLAQANFEGLYKTFQDDSRLAEMFSGFKKDMNKIGVKEFGLGDILLKYPKTPGNIMARGLDYSPAGFVKSVFELGKAVTNKGFDQKNFVDSTSRALIGTAGLTSVGYGLSQLGLLRNTASTNADVREIEKSAGLNQSQLNITGLMRWIGSGFEKSAARMKPNDKLVTYDWAVPLSIPLSMGARAQERSKELASKPGAIDDYSSLIAAGLEGGLDTLGDQPLVKSFTQFGQSKSFSKALTKAAEGIPGSFTPTLFKQISQVGDNTLRDTKDSNPLKMAANLVLNKTPFNKALPERIDPFGRKMEAFQGGTNSLFNIFLNPAFVSEFKPMPESAMVYNLFKATGKTDALPKLLDSKEKFHGVDLEISAKNRSELQKLMGGQVQNFLGNLANNPQFQNVPDIAKAQLISKYLSNVKEQTLMQYFQAEVRSKKGEKEAYLKKLIDSNHLNPRQAMELSAIANQ